MASTSSAVKETKSYLETLDSQSKKRYFEKIKGINNEDPYQISPKLWNKDAKTFPLIAYPDVYTYLVLTVSAYTNEQFKAYKSLLAYNQFVNGWVQEVLSYRPNNCDNSIVKAKVMHSQKLNEKHLQPWIAIDSNGTILSAHCTCMAGLGESCTHVAAVLFFLEANSRLLENATCTGVPAYWVMPSPKVSQVSKISDIDFTAARTKKRKLDESINCISVIDQENTKETSLHLKDNRFASFLDRVYASGRNPAVFNVMKKYQNVLGKKKLPKSLSCLRNDSLVGKDLCEVLKFCSRIELVLSDEEVTNVEESTREQSLSSLWFSMKEGRITASKLYDVCRTKISKPSISLVKNICNPKSIYKSSAMKRGLELEPQVKEAYETIVKPKHIDFTITSCGLYLHKDFPFMGASPDGIVNCSCCGRGCIEIKCPSALEFISFKDVVEKDKDFCIENTNDEYRLKHTHRYFYQIQAQMFLSNSKYCDFIVWSPFGTFIQRIKPDHVLWQSALLKSTNFFHNVILPELVAKVFTKKIDNSENIPCSSKSDSSSDKAIDSLLLSQVVTSLDPKETTSNTSSPNNSSTLQVAATFNVDTDSHVVFKKEEFCICKGEDEGLMISCDNPKCSIEWFHYECVGIKRAPKGSWYCSECKKNPLFQKEKLFKSKSLKDKN